MLVDSVICAAAEAMSLPPQTVRPAIVAAFVRARDARLTTEAVAAALSPPKTVPATGKGEGKRKP